jgi:hypothetical protein
MGSSMPPLVERMSARIRSNRRLFYTAFVERISARIKSNKLMTLRKEEIWLGNLRQILDYVECSEAVYDETQS